MSTFHPLAPKFEIPTFDTIMRSRLAELVHRSGCAPTTVAIKAGWTKMTLRRKLVTDPEDQQYRGLRATDVDVILGALDLTVSAILGPVLRPGDLQAMGWISDNTPTDPAPSTALWRDWNRKSHLGCLKTDRTDRLVAQGLIILCKTPHVGTYLRLTPTGRRVLR